ncbi:TetR/AcrR family transcriptional regulator [Amycolatopsis sp. DG1A-15b]|uniref:TetR/AcrR family transcriptional regulator n=1 Tax=Amycolatopsis sp. DG1A-15b TaxID=3052846 RepID=UPI00255BA44F|nr:TetR/AcrR family transcriptional regulator [Amycolatopsis sp. DG1A-15b]WIX84326.1 TetR/AcrR family transcriptional regulator [Amycolatopsis sp. DG1A-15b]
MTLPPPPWRSAPRRRAAKPVLSQASIVRAALIVLDDEGFDAVTMRRIAQELETGPASLYAHVSNKDELAELMLDAVLADVHVPEPDPARWDEQVKDLVRDQIRVMAAHRGIARIAWDIAVPVTPHSLKQGEAMLALLRAGGLTLKQATFAGDALSLYAKAYAYEASSWTWGEIDQAEAGERGKQMVAYMRSLPAESFPNMLHIGEFFSAETAAERLEFALDTHLAGLKVLAAKN